MNSFWKTFLAATLGVLVATFLLTLLSFGFFAALISATDQPVRVRPNSVLHIKLDQQIPELTNNIAAPAFSLDNDKILGLQEIRSTIQQAAVNDNIKGIFLEVDLVNAPFTTTRALRESLLEFQGSGKFIIAYSDFYGQQAYYLSSVADELYTNPIGLVDLRGFNATIPFFPELFDKIGLHLNIFYAGKFKSATEPFRRNSMSDENRLQTREYLQELYEQMLADIAESRKLSVPDLRRAIGTYAGLDPFNGLEEGLLDQVITRGEVIEKLKERLGLEPDDGVKMISLTDFNAADPAGKNYKARNKIAVLYAEGSIVGGKGENGSIGDHKYVKLIRQLKSSSSVKAVVLRVNSPGGSALASENILRELNELKAADIPVVVSMGDYAASGGYYIACGADSIFAEPTTITGSIGVFSIFPDVSRMMNDKIGISFDTVNTAPLAAAFSPLFELSPTEIRLMNARTEQTYEIFLQRVADGRDLPVEEVKKIAQGRVWTGKQAQDRRLVDGMGGLDRAVRSAAAMAGLQEGEFRLATYPAVKDPLMQLIEEITGAETGASMKQRALQEELGTFYPYYRQFKELAGTPGVQARLPVMIEF